MDEGRKDDGEKLRYDLLPPEALQSVVKVYTFGAKKYSPRNWEKGILWSRIFSGIMRHMWAWYRGEDLDPETGLPHTAHATFGCLALLQYMNTKTDFDDRPNGKGDTIPSLYETLQKLENQRMSVIKKDSNSRRGE